jgi:hypothetical protein
MHREVQIVGCGPAPPNVPVPRRKTLGMAELLDGFGKTNLDLPLGFRVERLQTKLSQRMLNLSSP